MSEEEELPFAPAKYFQTRINIQRARQGFLELTT